MLFAAFLIDYLFLNNKINRTNLKKSPLRGTVNDWIYIMPKDVFIPLGYYQSYHPGVEVGEINTI